MTNLVEPTPTRLEDDRPRPSRERGRHADRLTRAGQQAPRRCRSCDRAGAGSSSAPVSSRLDQTRELGHGCRSSDPLAGSGRIVVRCAGRRTVLSPKRVWSAGRASHLVFAKRAHPPLADALLAVVRVPMACKNRPEWYNEVVQRPRLPDHRTVSGRKESPANPGLSVSVQSSDCVVACWRFAGLFALGA